MRAGLDALAVRVAELLEERQKLFELAKQQEAEIKQLKEAAPLEVVEEEKENLAAT
jgi:hypothetical protein